VRHFKGTQEGSSAFKKKGRKSADIFIGKKAATSPKKHHYAGEKSEIGQAASCPEGII